MRIFITIILLAISLKSYSQTNATELSNLNYPISVTEVEENVIYNRSAQSWSLAENSGVPSHACQVFDSISGSSWWESDNVNGIRMYENIFSTGLNANCVRWTGADFTNAYPCATPATEFKISYFADNAGQPGALFAGPFTGTPSQRNYLPLQGHNPKEYIINHPNIELQPGTIYWISIEAQLTAPCHWMWNASSPDGDNVSWLERYNSNLAGVYPGNMAVCVYGELDPIPTVSEWGLIFFALSLLSLSAVLLYRKERKSVVV